MRVCGRACMSKRRSARVCNVVGLIVFKCINLIATSNEHLYPRTMSRTLRMVERNNQKPVRS